MRAFERRRQVGGELAHVRPPARTGFRGLGHRREKGRSKRDRGKSLKPLTKS